MVLYLSLYFFRCIVNIFCMHTMYSNSCIESTLHGIEHFRLIKIEFLCFTPSVHKAQPLALPGAWLCHIKFFLFWAWHEDVFISTTVPFFGTAVPLCGTTVPQCGMAMPQCSQIRFLYFSSILFVMACLGGSVFCTSDMTGQPWHGGCTAGIHGVRLWREFTFYFFCSVNLWIRTLCFVSLG